MNRGTILAISAYFLWGLLPLYWKLLEHVPSIEILAHRIAWSFACFVLFFIVTRRSLDFRTVTKNRRHLLTLTATSLLITANWGIYIWAVNHHHVVETSLGYFINPLVSVALGVLLLGERLRPLQWISTVLAASGVIYLTISYGRFPWIAISLALSFGLYGLLKKRSPVTTMQGMFFETSGVILPSLGYLIWIQSQHTAAFLSDFPTTSLLLASGALTALPLLLFSAAAKRIPLSTLGLLQYLAPTLQFLIGILIFHEPFGRDRLIGFTIIWIALAIFTTDRLLPKSKS